jgi:hypothetical protein
MHNITLEKCANYLKKLLQLPELCGLRIILLAVRGAWG